MQALFSVPFLQLKLNQEDLAKCQTEASLALGRYGEMSPPGYVSESYRTFKDKDYNILFKPEMGFTNNAVSSCLAHLCEGLNFNPENMIIADSWLNKFEKGMGQEVHNHARYTFSFMLYLSVPEGTPPLLFYNPYRPMMTGSSPLDIPIIQLPITEGLFVIFPSYVDHSAPTQMTTKAKISLAGNIFYDSTPRPSIITK